MLEWDLFLTFLKLGMFTFGGGYAMIPLIEKEIIEKKKWIDEEELLEILSIAQMTPGVIAINIATFVGRKIAGLKGALIATLGVVIPSIITISLIVNYFGKYMLNPKVANVLLGIRAGVVTLICITIYKLIRKGLINKLSLAIYLGIVGSLIRRSINSSKSHYFRWNTWNRLLYALS